MTPSETVLACLQKYADRGIFRGFGVRPTHGGRLEWRFLWHGPAPHRLRLEPRRKALVFVDLLPGIPYPSAMDRALRSYVAGRSSEELPEHRRLDRAKANAGCRNRAGSVSIEVRCLDGDFEYAATRAIKLINEVFLDFLAGPYDAYMVEHFGAPEE